MNRMEIRDDNVYAGESRHGERVHAATRCMERAR